MKKLHPASVRAVLFLAVVCGWVGWVALSYRARSLSYWMDDDGDSLSRDGPSEAGIAAIQKMGTNSLPALLEMAGARESTFKKKLLDWTQLRQYPETSLGFYRDWALRMRARWGFRALGQTAQPAVPALVRSARDTNPEVQINAMMCIGVIGPAAEQAVPELMALATNADLSVRATAKIVLGEIHAQPTAVIPLLVESLKTNPQDLSSRAAMEALGKFGREAKEAVPVLVQFLTNANTLNRQYASNTLLKIDPEAAEKLGVRRQIISPGATGAMRRRRRANP